MKTLITFFVFAILSEILLAQSPQKMNYQVVIRNSSNQLVTSTPVGIRLSILKGSENGIPMYVETQTPVSNANGLVTVEIGSGKLVSGSFGMLNWAEGPYFLKTETDPGSGTNYTLSLTNQLTGVPFALYATQAGNGFSGNYNDLTNKPLLFDGSWTSLKGKPDFKTVATSGNYADLINKPVLFSGNYNDLANKPTLAKVATSGSYIDLSDKPLIDGSETKVTAGTNISVSGSGTSATPYIINLDIHHHIGELYGGGVVFYVDRTGKHGLICCMTDLGPEIWSNINDAIGATLFSTWDGQANTLRIISQAGHTTSAAELCDSYINTDYGTGIYSDWFLPSINQLCLLDKAIFEVCKTLENDGNSSTTPIFYQSYWSSNEYRLSTHGYPYGDFYSFMHFVQNAGRANSAISWIYKSNAMYVRAIRSF
jgi:hypothetical protein